MNVKSICRCGSLLALLAVPIACDSTPVDLHISTGEAPDVTLAIPEFIARVVTPSNLSAIAVIDGTELELQNSGDSFTGSIDLPSGSSPTVSLTWYDNSELTRLPLATFEQSMGPITANAELVIAETDYSQLGLDADNDGFNNLAELRVGTDAFDINQPGGTVLVRFPRVTEAEKPDIDGRYSNTDGFSVWNYAVFSSTVPGPELLRINNLLVGQGDQGRLNGENDEYIWAGLHDGESMYLFIFGEYRADTLFSDSDNPHDDDAVNIFIDADNSKLTEYDGVNDYHIVIPLLSRGGAAHNNRTTVRPATAGPNSAPLPASIEFATCLCGTDRYSWEVKLNMADFGLVFDRPFGLDIQLDEDNDGGTRDARWSWAVHAARANLNADITAFNPSTMATVKLANETNVP